MKPRVYEIHPRKAPKELRKPGQQPIWPTPEGLQIEVDEYFEKAREEGWHITITGMLNYLKVDRASWELYRKKEDFKHVISYIRSVCEEYLLNKMLDQNVAPATGIFLLKNHHGYVDKVEQEIKHTHNIAEELEQRRLQVEEMKKNLLTSSTELAVMDDTSSE